ncbi:protein boule [Trichuris trichiura]|uniref:Protein boule n=1 Tax=Trichuris trichiura TaxID=36087 RepID=A0A077ZGH8_TRITR|nr:protein boule [Trichuris trichiura]
MFSLLKSSTSFSKSSLGEKVGTVMSTVALGTPESNRDLSGVSSVSSTPSLTTVSTPRVGTLIPNRIFVGGFPPVTVEHELRTFFEKFGCVKEVKIIRDPSGTSKGYGFITYETDEEAKKMQEKAEPLEFKGRNLNIGPAVRKASSQFKTYDIVPQGAVLCSYGVPYTLQNGITLVAATPEAYAVAQPSQQTLSYPVVLPQPVQQILYPSVPLANAQTPGTPAVAIATQHQSAATQAQPCLTQHIQQSHSSPNSPSKVGIVGLNFDGICDCLQKAATAAPLTFQPNLVPLGNVINGIPNIGGLALNGGTMTQQSQYRLTTPAMAPPEMSPYTTNAYIHPEYAEVYPNGYESYSEGRSSHYSPRKQQQYGVSHSATGNATSPRYASASQRNSHRYSGKSSGSSSYHKVITYSSCEFDASKTDMKQPPPGSVVTPPPTPITAEYKG